MGRVWKSALGDSRPYITKPLGHLKEDHDVMRILRSLLPAQERLVTPLGSTSPTLFETVVWVLLHVCPTRTSKWKWCEMGPTVFRSYPRRLDSLTICRCHYKAALSSQLFKDPECWSSWALNSRPPAQKTSTILVTSLHWNSCTSPNAKQLLHPHSPRLVVERKSLVKNNRKEI